MISPRLAPPVGALLSDGNTVSKTAWTIALGFAIGSFPLIGVTTIVCVLVAGLLRIKQASIQLGNYAALPLQIILLIPCLRFGERITGAERFVFDPVKMLKSFPNVSETTARALVMAQWHMIEGWGVIAPMIFILAGLTAKALMRRNRGIRQGL